MNANSGFDGPRSGPTQIAVGETHGPQCNCCATPKGSNGYLAHDRGQLSTAIHVVSLRDNPEERPVLFEHLESRQS